MRDCHSRFGAGICEKQSRAFLENGQVISYQLSATGTLANRFRHPTCNSYGVGRVPTRSASSFKWEEGGPLTGWYGLLPPASEREARLDDPIDSATTSAESTERDFRRLWNPKLEPPYFFSWPIAISIPNWP
jgi:hypothetical protein